MAEEQVGHSRYAGDSVLSIDEFLPYLRCIGHESNVDDDALFLADGAVEILDVSVHGRICLLAVDVPHCERDGLLRIEQRFLPIAPEKQKRKHTNKNDYRQSFFHKEIPCFAKQSAGSARQKILKKIQTFLNFPYLLGVWVGDKRHFNPYTFVDDIVSIYFRKYILILCCINHYTITMRNFQELSIKISRQTEGESRPETTSKEGT